MHDRPYKPKVKGDATKEVSDSYDYVYGNTTSAGHERVAKPLFLAGVERGIIEELGQDLAQTNAAPITAKGSLNFEENIDVPTAKLVTDDYVNFVYVGIDRPHRLHHEVLHRKILKVTKQLSVDIHYLFLRMLAGKGVVFTPYFYRGDRYGYYLWAEKWNYQLGLSSPYDPLRRRVTMPRVYPYDDEPIVDLKKDINFYVRAVYESGGLKRSDDVLGLLRSFPGVTSIAARPKSIAIRHQDHVRPLLLNALVYQSDFEFDRLTEKLRREKRITQEKCEEEFKRIVRLREARHWSRYGTPKLRWTLETYPFSEYSKSPQNEPQKCYSTLGRIWSGAISADAKFGESFHRLGATCDELGHRLGKLREIAGDCFEETESTCGGRSGHQSVLTGTSFSIEGMRRSIEAFRDATKCAERALAEPRQKTDEGRKLGSAISRFTGAIHHVGGCLASYPRSTADVIEFIDNFFRNRRISPSKVKWFSDPQRLELRPDIWAWLRFCHASGIRDLEDCLEANRLFLPASKGLETWLTRFDSKDQR